MNLSEHVISVKSIITCFQLMWAFGHLQIENPEKCRTPTKIEFFENGLPKCPNSERKII